MHFATPSYVDGKLRVLTPGNEYPDFLKTGLDAPKPVKEGINKEEAEKIAGKLKDAGATAEIK